MKQAKGCGNVKCTANKKKITYKGDDKFCPKCGLNLIIVCKDCKTPLPEGDSVYCVRCEAERGDRKDKAIDGAKKVGGVVLSVGALAITAVSGGKIRLKK